MLTITDPRDDRANRRGKTIIMDVGPDMYGWTGPRGLADLLEVAGHFIDVAKIWALNAATMPEAYVREAVRQYGDAGIETFSGGLLFEYAYLKDDVGGLISRLHHLGIGGVEVSENYVSLNDNERLRAIGLLAEAGLNVVFEYGRKRPDKPLDIGELETTVARSMAAGAHHIILEQGEFDLLAKERPDELKTLKSAPWFDAIFIEIDSDRFPTQHIDMIKQFGPEVNLANVAPAHVIRLENFRRGRGRAMDYPFFRKLAAESEQTGG